MEEERKYCVYMHIAPNGKKYIGATSIKPSERWGGSGQRYKNNPLFYHDILKFGWEQFEHIIIKDNLTADEAELLEIDTIKKYSTTDKNKGYNYQNGGRFATSESKKKMSESHKGKTRQGKQVAAYNTDGNLAYIFDDSKEAAKYFSINNTNTIRSRIFQHKYINGLRWEYFTGELKIEKYIPVVKKRKPRLLSDNSNAKRIIQYTEDGKYIQTFDCIKEASKQLGYGYKYFSEQVKNGRNIGGYKWEYADEDVVKI